MITILIADDEKVIRSGMAKILRESLNVPVEIIEAKNGKIALELCKTEQPNILITDIRMPIMDGVELMQNISKLENKPVIIITSGYDDFVYAKAAIQMGAISYILKPLDKKELISAVQQSIESFRISEHKMDEETLKKIIDENRVDCNAKISGYNFENGYYCIVVNGSYTKNILQQVLNSVDYYLLESKKEWVVAVIPKDALHFIESDSSLKDYVVGISSTSYNISSLRTYKKQAVNAMLQSYFSGEKNSKKNGLYYYSKLSKEPNYSDIDSVYEKLIAKINISEVKDIQDGLNALLSFDNENKEYSACALYYIYNKFKANLFTRFSTYSDNDLYLCLKAIMIKNIWELKTLDDWKACISDYLIYLNKLIRKKTVEYLFINEAIEYIKENFTKDINMTMVANYVSVNYTYFSEKFKEHTGMFFNDYLRKMRIDKACDLLKKDCYKVYEIAEKTGFCDVKYFMKTFKKETGLSPTEWKKTHLT